MHLSALQKLTWGGNFLGETALCLVLITRGRWRGYIAFTLLIGCQAISDVVIYSTYTFGSEELWSTAYWAFVFVNFPFQLAVVIEMARIVLRPTGTWVRDARREFLTWAIAGAALALICSLLVTPPNASAKETMELRGNLFTSLLILELFVAVTLASNTLGLGWRNHVMALAQGLTLWSVVGSIVDGLHSYLGARTAYGSVENLRSLAFFSVLVYWIVQFWRPEPKRQPLAPELQKYITELHDRVRLDLNQVS